MGRWILPGVLLAAALAVGPAAQAQEPPAVAEARAHFERAVSLFDAGRAAEALGEFQRAYELSGRTSVLYNLGATYQALRDYPRAIDALERYVASTAERPTPERALALRALAQMEPLVARLRVRRDPADASVQLDGRALEGDRVVVLPGTHVLAASSPGHVARQIEVVVAPRDERDVLLSLAPTPAAVTVVAPPVVAPPVVAPPVVTPAPRRPPSRAPFWAAVITGSALAVGASIAGGFAIAAQSDYATHRVGDPQAPALADRGRALAWTADLMGVGALAAGVTALVLGLRDDRGAPARALVVPTPGGVSIAGAF